MPLCLSRKVGESIMIGDNIKITVVGIDRGKVRIGVAADRSVPIMRSELLTQVEGEIQTVTVHRAPPLSHSRPTLGPAVRPAGAARHHGFELGGEGG